MRFLALAIALLGCRSEARESARALKEQLAEPGHAFSLGIVADSKEPLPATLDNLKRFAGAFARAKVAAVLALGGLGASEDEIAKVLSALKEAHAPILALPGDREPEGAFHAAVERAKKSGLQVIDLAKVRAVDAGGFALVSLPGYPWPHYLGAGSAGLRYQPTDVDQLAALFDGLPSPKIVASHTPPRGQGPDAIDWALGGANVGDPALTRVMNQLGSALGAFAHVDESGGRAQGTIPDGGAGSVGENVWTERLWVNAGAADAVPHTMIRGETSRGQAAVVEFLDGRFRYKVIR
jgi:hypothetical protein